MIIHIDKLNVLQKTVIKWEKVNVQSPLTIQWLTFVNIFYEKNFCNVVYISKHYSIAKKSINN